MSIATDLDVLARLEAHLADLYELFAERLTANPAVAALFSRMALEERSHANTVSYQRRIIDQNPAEFIGLALDVEELYHLTMQVKQARSLSPLDARTALRVALGFERSAAEAHWRMASGNANPAFNAFLARLGAEDDEHRARLEQFAATLELTR